LAPKAAEFGEITQSNDHYAVHGHSRSLISVPIEKAHMRLAMSD